MGLTVIGNEDGAVLMDNVSGFPLQGCRGFASATDAEAFLEWYAGLAETGSGFDEAEFPADLRVRPAFEVSDLRDRWDRERDGEPSS